MTDIVIVPAAPVVPLFPELGSADFNQTAYNFGVAMPGVSSVVRDIAVTAHTNATAAKEQALASAASAGAASGSATQATANGAAQVTLAAAQVALAAQKAALATTNGAAQVTLAAWQVTLATAQADAAMGYRNTAGAHATTATNQAGIATTKAGEAAASAVQASKLNLGGKSTPPTLDNQGGALLTGATYYDTTLSKWRVWTDAAWGDGVSAIAGVSSINGETGPVTGIATTANITAERSAVATLTNKTISFANNTLIGVQPTLVSGTNIKTLNGESVLGAGNIQVQGFTLAQAHAAALSF